MMLHQFTWQQFLVAAAVLTLIWYGLLFASWYLKHKAGFGAADKGSSAGSALPLRHAWETGVDVLTDEVPAEDDLMGASQGPQGLSRVGMSDFSFAPPAVSVEAGPVVAEASAVDEGRLPVRPPANGPFLQGTVADFLEELKPVFDYAVRYKKGLPVFLEQLQALLGRYPEIMSGPYREDIVDHVCELAVESLPFAVTPEEIYASLEQEAG